MICKKCNKFEITCRNECKVCGFKKRRKDDIDNVLKNGFWTIEELETIIYSILYSKYDCINDIVPMLNDKNLDDIVFLLTKDMKILGLATSKVGVNCCVCGKFHLINLSQYNEMKRLGTKKYCSIECRNNGFNIFGSHVGENNHGYNSKMIHCTNCGKEFLAPKYIQEQTNSFGENNHYCSQQCYWEYRKGHYVGDKSGMTNRQYTKEERLLQSERTTKRICDGGFRQTKTKPHNNICTILNFNNINYNEEFNLKYQALDIYLEDYNLGIEIMGDYWHSNPNKYEFKNLNKTQLKDKKQDKRKNTYTKKYYGFEILYLWESEIKNNIELCELLIKEYINKNGILQDYNSFNYYVNGNELLLKSEIVKPYFIN